MPINLAKTLIDNFQVKAFSLVYLNLLSASDNIIFNKAREKRNVIIITKDEDFVNICILNIPPPNIVWVTIGNIKNEVLFNVFKNKFIETVTLLFESKLPCIEIDS